MKDKSKFFSAYPIFNDRHPIWKCPDCGELNRFLDTFFEPCCKCGTDHTMDWDEYIGNKK